MTTIETGHESNRWSPREGFDLTTHVAAGRSSVVPTFSDRSQPNNDSFKESMPSSWSLQPGEAEWHKLKVQD